MYFDDRLERRELRYESVFAVSADAIAAADKAGVPSIDPARIVADGVDEGASLPTPATFEPTWYRRLDRGFSLGAYEDSGDLTVNADALVFTAGKKTVRIPNDRILSVRWEPMPRDIANYWVVVRSPPTKGSRYGFCFRDGGRLRGRQGTGEDLFGGPSRGEEVALLARGMRKERVPGANRPTGYNRVHIRRTGVRPRRASGGPMRQARSAGMAAALFLLFAVVAFSQDAVDLAVVDRIKSEAFARSEVMDQLYYLTDVHGPRLTGSPQFDQAAKWAIERLTSYGVSNVRLDRWGPFGRSWSIEQQSVELLTPQYARLAAMPLAWSASTSGVVSGEPILAPFELSFTRGPKRLAEDFERYRQQWRGRLRGRIVLFTPAQATPPRERPAFSRYTDEGLADLGKAPEPAAVQRATTLDELEWPEREEDLTRLFASMPEGLLDQVIERYDALAAQRAAFLNDEGVSAVLIADGRAREGLLAAEAASGYRARDRLAPATFVVTAEQYNRIVRLLQHKQPVRLRVELKATASASDVEGSNVVGEIPGGARKDEVVMIGAHFDSWHSSTGATDNATGSAVMIEVMRILKALNLQLDRTVRIALWGGEEQGLLGSRAYVKAHFADPDTMALAGEYEKLSGYFNLDNGGGRIRGVYLQQHEAMRPIFQQWLAPFRDLGVTTITIQNTGGTDHLSFARVGLPAFQFIQDGLDYGTTTHHTSADSYDHVVPADLMQASAVIATVVYQAANRPERLPRREVPKAK